ncbi:hypothetical protein R6Q57_013425 [Mikania cordata]
MNFDNSKEKIAGTSIGMYYIEYTLKNPGESERHLLSVLGIANNGWYNRLYTLTGQYIDEESEKYRSKVEKIRLTQNTTKIWQVIRPKNRLIFRSKIRPNPSKFNSEHV